MNRKMWFYRGLAIYNVGGGWRGHGMVWTYKNIFAMLNHVDILLKHRKAFINNNNSLMYK